MIEFTVTRITERGDLVTESGRASVEDVDSWNREIKEAVRTGDNAKLIKITTDDDNGNRYVPYVRAILVKSVDPVIRRPAGW
jgi:hypothetical protein